MKEIRSLAIRHTENVLSILDQTLLPHEEKWIRIEDPQSMIECIQRLAVRGAPLIGVAAALTLGKLKEWGVSFENYQRQAGLIRDSRPTAVNLMWAVDQMKAHYDDAVERAEQIFDEDVALCDAIAENGSHLIENDDGVLTHCNAGALATAGVGTAIGVIHRAFEKGRRFHVFVDETRPLLQGARLTAWELSKLGIPYTLLCDNMAAALMRAKKINKVIVGADRIAKNGDFANKIGTYGVAVLAKHHGIAFYVAAPRTTQDPHCASGADIPIENRKPEEVRNGRAVRDCEVYNPAFDVTPKELVTGYVLDSGFFPMLNEG